MKTDRKNMVRAAVPFFITDKVDVLKNALDELPELRIRCVSPRLSTLGSERTLLKILQSYKCGLPTNANVHQRTMIYRSDYCICNILWRLSLDVRLCSKDMELTCSFLEEAFSIMLEVNEIATNRASKYYRAGSPKPKKKRTV